MNNARAIAGRRFSGSRLTMASFGERTEWFPTAKAAYLWLVENFLSIKPEIFEHITWETVSLAKGRTRNYFAKSPRALFNSSPDLAKDLNKYAQLSNGWFANTNLSNSEKRRILNKFAQTARASDWRWIVQTPSPALLEQLHAEQQLKKIDLAKLLADF